MTKKAKPIHPKPLRSGLRQWLVAVTNGAASPSDFTEFDAGAILDALEYERQRAEGVRPEVQAARPALAGVVVLRQQPAPCPVAERIARQLAAAKPVRKRAAKKRTK